MTAVPKEPVVPKPNGMIEMKHFLNRYLTSFPVFRDRSFPFQLTVIILLIFVFSFTITRILQLAQQPTGNAQQITSAKPKAIKV